jgi:hypothetical protein
MLNIKIKKSSGQELVGRLFRLITTIFSLRSLGDLAMEVSRPPLMNAYSSHIRLCESQLALTKRFESCFN